MVLSEPSCLVWKLLLVNVYKNRSNLLVLLQGSEDDEDEEDTSDGSLLHQTNKEAADHSSPIVLEVDYTPFR